MSWLSKLFGAGPSRQNCRDEVLGELIWRADESAWLAPADAGRRDFEIVISADKGETPDPDLIAWARAIDRLPRDFEQEVRDFVCLAIGPWGGEAASWPIRR